MRRGKVKKSEVSLFLAPFFSPAPLPAGSRRSSRFFVAFDRDILPKQVSLLLAEVRYVTYSEREVRTESRAQKVTEKKE